MSMPAHAQPSLLRESCLSLLFHSSAGERLQLLSMFSYLLTNWLAYPARDNTKPKTLRDPRPNYMLLPLIKFLNARSVVLERPNRGIDKLYNAASSSVSLKQITAVLEIGMAVSFSHTLVDVKLFAHPNISLSKLELRSALQNFDHFQLILSVLK